MTVILVLATFLAFVVLDYLLNRHRAVITVAAERPTIPSAHRAGEHVQGFLVPADLSYHPGHSWLAQERKDVMRVGADEFAATLVAGVHKIELPKPGQWIRQGQKIVRFYRDGEKTEMVSPTEGEVLEVNSEVLKNPALLRNDPYGKGWLLTVHVPDQESTGRNLIPTGLVQGWMANAVERLYARQPALAGAVAADGGRPSDEFLGSLPDANWRELTGEFFLTGETL